MSREEMTTAVRRSLTLGDVEIALRDTKIKTPTIRMVFRNDWFVCGMIEFVVADALTKRQKLRAHIRNPIVEMMKRRSFDIIEIVSIDDNGNDPSHYT